MDRLDFSGLPALFTTLRIWLLNLEGVVLEEGKITDVFDDDSDVESKDSMLDELDELNDNLSDTTEDRQRWRALGLLLDDPPGE